MKIKLTNRYGFIEEWPVNKSRLINDFTVVPSAAPFMGRHARPVKFVSEKQGKFGIGLVPAIKNWCDSNNEQLEIIDTRDIRSPITTNNIELRDYQLEAIEALFDAVVGTVQIPTGGGKTYIMAGLVERLNRPTVIIVPRINLVLQTVGLFRKLGINNVGAVGGGRKQWDRSIVVASDASASKALDKLARFEAIIVDECHHASAAIYRKILRSASGAVYRFGLSGTPRNNDKLANLYRESLLGQVVYKLPTSRLIADGQLSRPTIRMIQIDKPQVIHGDYTIHYRKAIVENHYRNSIIARFATGLKGKTIVLFGLIDHGHILRDMMPSALYMDGQTPADERDKIIKGFNRSREGILIASKIADEGIDFSSIHNLIIATGEKSPIKVIQRLGRGLRSDGPGDIVNVIDFYDETSKYLLKQSKNRLKLYQGEGHTVKIFKLT